MKNNKFPEVGFIIFVYHTTRFVYRELIFNL